MMDIGLVIALIKALAPKADTATITAAVDAWLDDHPEATTTVEDGSITYAKLATALAALIDGKYDEPSGGIPATDMTSAVQALLSSVGAMIAATSGDVGKALSPKTVADDKVTEWQFVSAGGGGGGGAVDDVQVNGVSVVTNGVAKIPLVSNDSGIAGAVKVNAYNGLSVMGGILGTNPAYDTDIKAGTQGYKPITSAKQHMSAFYGLAKAAGDSTQSASNNNVGVYTESAKSAISQMLDAPESVSGSTPSITAKAGVRYICGECSTLSITAPESGCIDVVFESGTTPTVLTVTSAKSGVSAIKWANGFDPTALDASTTYEINILDGEFGVVGSWT